ncbi:hypothetical protein F8271_32055, partial [Micromonospora sp. ALFpr18c]
RPAATHTPSLNPHPYNSISSNSSTSTHSSGVDNQPRAECRASRRCTSASAPGASRSTSPGWKVVSWMCSARRGPTSACIAA